MSTSDTVLPNESPEAPARPKHRRFAGERLGAWLFAASFSVGIWGLALKVLEPSHPPLSPGSTPEVALLAPSDAPDGHALVIWGVETDPSIGYPVVAGVPLAPADEAARRRD